MSLPVVVIHLEDCQISKVEATQPCRVLILENADFNGYDPEDRSNYLLLPDGDYVVMSEEFAAEVVPSLLENLQRLQTQQRRCPRCGLPLLPEEPDGSLCFICAFDLEGESSG